MKDRKDIEDIKAEIKTLKLELSLLQRKINQKSIPVLIMIDGFGAAGIGQVISALISEMDPRHFKVHVFDQETETEKRRPKLWRFWNHFPQKGKMAIFDKSYYTGMFYDCGLSKKAMARDLQIYRETEKMLVDDGYLVLKFFLDIDKKVQKKRLDKLSKNPSTAFRVNKYDLKENKDHKKYKHHFYKLVGKSDFTFAPWQVVDANDMDEACYQVLNQVKLALEEALNRPGREKVDSQRDYQARFSLRDIDLNTPPMEAAEYKIKLKKLQKEARDLAYLMYIHKIPTILVFEGWDAAGKGGAIKRLLKKVDPRGYEVVPIAAPSPYDQSMHYLSRFYRHLPKTGHMALFDRSWYGRLMVERVEGFAEPCQWQRAFDEINSFERSLTDWGALVLKFFIHIDQETQLGRFHERQANPLKQYKITEEDWRNREKWEDYYGAISEMIDKTNQSCAPWIIVEGNDKKYARLKVLKTFIAGAKAALNHKPKDPIKGPVGPCS